MSKEPEIWERKIVREAMERLKRQEFHHKFCRVNVTQISGPMNDITMGGGIETALAHEVVVEDLKHAMTLLGDARRLLELQEGLRSQERCIVCGGASVEVEQIEVTYTFNFTHSHTCPIPNLWRALDQYFDA